MEAILRREEKPAVDEMVEFLKDLTVQEQEEMAKYMAAFKEGFEFARRNLDRPRKCMA
ncbi:hypothetical protein [Clostridium coskatii]|uniref:Uncharacterized protein n=1 Tax=Clostridium coskatii TaxID=1705578 RepID=A0A166TUC9_9CLOT|nr:hypothetical protein [Clostridium coskatii]OAA94109.1 hypothetical protein WX73_03679 [Clostridium coskatii]OBR96671.1 hypothetical protein CLCOS_08330 [Clostridium coskatii]